MIYAGAIAIHLELWNAESFSLWAIQWELFETPIGIAKAGLAICGLYALAFRSQQTAEQISKTTEQIDKAEKALEETKSNNIYSNYLRHKEATIVDFNTSAKRCRLQVSDPEVLYNRIFPKNSPFYFSPNPSMQEHGYFLERLITDFNEVFHEVSKFASSNSDELKGILMILNERLRAFHKSMKTVNVDAQTVWVDGVTISSDPIMNLKRIGLFIKELVSIAHWNERFPSLDESLHQCQKVNALASRIKNKSKALRTF